MKYISTFAILLSLHTAGNAQSKFPYDSVRHMVEYSETIKLNPKIKTDDVYASAIAWFGDASKFTRKNAIVPLDTMVTKKIRRKTEAEELFANPRPLQIQDPAGNKAQGMGIIRYYSTGNSIKLLYIKYDIAIQVKPDAAEVSVSNFRYFHYAAGSYKQVPLYNFAGGKPCEEVGTLEALIACEDFHDEFSHFALYCNKEIIGQIADFKNLLKQKKYLYDPKATTAKAPAKTTTKGPAKKK